jgi:hypothetical protein
MIKMIPCVEARDMPKDVLEYCIDHEISTHYQSDIAQVEDNNNPFANWLRENGYEFEETRWGFDYVGVIAT